MAPVRIPREELTARVARSLEAGAVSLTAGAGFGKSTTLELALERLGWPVARVSCEGQTGDAGRLLTRIVAAIQAAAPGVADVLADRLAGGMGPIDVATATDALTADLDRLLVDPLVLVLDDAENVAGDREALTLISTLLAARPGRLRIAVASRRPLRLRVAKLRSAGRLDEVGETELAFTADECAEYVQARAGRAPDPDDLAALMATTRGWPLAVALSAPGSRAAAPGRPAAELVAFLAEEVLDQVPAPLRDQVLDSSVVAELDDGVLAALGLPGDLRADVRDAGLLLESRDGDGRWRYHPLLREVLVDQLRAERDADRFAELCVRAAAASPPEEAVRLLLAAERHEEAAAAIAQAGPALLRTSWRTVRGWLDALPAAARAAPPLQLLDGQLLLAEGEQPRGDAVLREAEAGFRAAGVVAGEWAARWFRAAAYHETGDWEEIARLAEDFTEDVGVAAGPPALALAFWGAFAQAARGDVAGARAMCDRVRAVPGAELMAPVEVGLRGYIDIPGGHIDDVLAFALRTLARLGDGDVLGMRANLEASIALMYFELGRDEDALAHWDRTIEAVDRLGAHQGIAVHAQVHRAVLLAHLGRAAEAERCLARAEPLPEMGFRETWVHQARAAIAWRRGDAGAAVAACRRAFDVLRPIQVTADRSWAMRTLVPVLAGLGERALARRYVDETLAYWDEALPGDDGCFWRARTLAERGWLRHADGEVGAGVDDLREAWALAPGTEGHLLRVQWPSVQPLLWDALERRAIDPAEALAAVRSAVPDPGELAAFLDHPAPEVRAAAVAPAAVSGHPRAYAALRSLAADGSAAAEHALARLVEEPPPLAFTLLGGFGLRRGEWDVPPSAWERPATAALVRYLLVRSDGAVPEDDLFEALWPGRTEATARSSLRVALSRARSVLDPPGATASRIEGSRRTFRLRLGPADRVDAADFAAAAAQALAARGADRGDLLERAAALWTGEPLPEDRYADWARLWRSELIERHLQVLTALVRVRLQAGDHLGAAAAGRRLVDAEPLNENAHVQLMVAYARAGNRSSALRQYLACRGALVAELGLEPSQETQRVHRRLLAGEPI